MRTNNADYLLCSRNNVGRKRDFFDLVTLRSVWFHYDVRCHHCRVSSCFWYLRKSSIFSSYRSGTEGTTHEIKSNHHLCVLTIFYILTLFYLERSSSYQSQYTGRPNNDSSLSLFLSPSISLSTKEYKKNGNKFSLLLTFFVFFFFYCLVASFASMWTGWKEKKQEQKEIKVNEWIRKWV